MVFRKSTDVPIKAAWQAFLERVFPTYLTPRAMHQSIDAASAERFLTRLGGLPGDLALIRGASLLAGRDEQLRRFCCESLPALAHRLPSHTVAERRICHGGFHGPLILSETMKYLLEGAPNRFVTRSRTRTFEMLENQLVRCVVDRLLALIAGLRARNLLHRDHWGDTALTCEAELRRVLETTPLGAMRSDVAIASPHEQAAQGARDRGYEHALWWHRALGHALDDHESSELAKILSAGALRPKSIDAQFEIAVLVKLIHDIDTHTQAMEPDIWQMERSLVMAGRTDVARFVRARDGACVKVFYNQVTLPTRNKQLGPRDRGVRHFFASTGRIRPDITVTVEAPGRTLGAMIIEIKNSSNPKTWRSGYAEALAYRHEYADELLDWPKSVLVTSGRIPGDVPETLTWSL